MHKANLGSQLSIFDMGSFARARPRRNDPPERVHTGTLKRPARTTETNRQGRVGQTSCTNVHKANLGSQLSIFDTGSFAQARPRLNDPARTSSHGRPQTTRPNDPPEQVHVGASNDPLERPTQTISHGHPQMTRPNDPPQRVHTGALKRPARTILHGCPNDRNEATRESQANELHECAQRQPRVTT